MRLQGHCKYLYVSSLGLLAFTAQAQQYSGLPEPPRAMPTINSATYYLTLQVNGQTDNQVVPVIYRNGSYLVESGILAKNYVQLNGQQQGLVDVGALPNVKLTYNASAQQLIIDVPDDWLPRQYIAEKKLIDYQQAQSSTGLLFNYDAYYTHPYSGKPSVATYMEQRLFSRVGILSNTGVWHYQRDNNGVNNRQGYQHRYLRYDTYWRYSDERRLISYQLGDFVSNSLTWSHSARLGGLRISRNFGIRPDIVTYPLMQYSGTAAVPTTVDLFINGYKASSNTLNAGPFTLTHVPYINGAGEATVVTTDALGRQISTSVPFYASNQLLGEGLTDFDFSLGKIRKNYGVRHANYSDPAFSGIYRFGLSHYLTLSSHAETMRGLQLGGLGGDIAVGHWGTLSLSGSQSRADHRRISRRAVYPDGTRSNSAGAAGVTVNDTVDIDDYIDNGSDAINNQRTNGTQHTLGYSYYSELFGLTLQRASRTDGYQDLTSYSSNTRLSRHAYQAILSFSPFGQSNGSVGVGYFDVNTYHRSRTRLLNFSYSRSLWEQSSMFLSLNKTLGENSHSAQIQFIIPLNIGKNINIGTRRDSSGHYQQQIGASKMVPIDGGIGWDLAYANGNNSYQQADVTWKTRYATLQGGIYGPQRAYTHWAALSGSVVFINRDFFLADKINDAFIVVNTGDYADVPVLYENQKMGNTNKNGHLLIPNVTSFYPGKVGIDTMPLPADTLVPTISQQVSVREGGGVVVDFPVRRVLSATIRLQDIYGQPLKLGTLVTELHSQQTSIVGYDGLVYFTNLQQHNVLSVQQEDMSLCRVGFDMATNQPSIEQIGPLICRPTAKTAAKQEPK